MSESTLSLIYETLNTEIAVMLGYSRTLASRSTAQIAAIKSCLDSGLRQFYVQPDWEWSFLKPISTILLWPDVALDDDVTVTSSYSDPTSTLTASEATFHPSMIGRSIVITDVGTYTITGYTSTTVVLATANITASAKTFSIASAGLFGLSDDCQDIEGLITHAANSGLPSMVQRSESWLRSKRQREGSTTGPPVYWAVVPRSYTAATGQRSDLSVWPVPGEDRTITYRKVINLDLLATLQYPPGGMVHGETILESCLDVAEARYGDTQGVHAARYAKKLDESKRVDAKLWPDTLGQNRDSTRGGRRRSRHDGDFDTTVNGTLYE